MGSVMDTIKTFFHTPNEWMTMSPLLLLDRESVYFLLLSYIYNVGQTAAAAAAHIQSIQRKRCRGIYTVLVQGQSTGILYMSSGWYIAKNNGKANPGELRITGIKLLNLWDCVRCGKIPSFHHDKLNLDGWCSSSLSRDLLKFEYWPRNVGVTQQQTKLQFPLNDNPICGRKAIVIYLLWTATNRRVITRSQQRGDEKIRRGQSLWISGIIVLLLLRSVDGIVPFPTLPGLGS